jgi:hypothetical protein
MQAGMTGHYSLRHSDARNGYQVRRYLVLVQSWELGQYVNHPDYGSIGFDKLCDDGNLM